MDMGVVKRNFWGRSRFGGGTAVLLVACSAIALAVSGAIAGYALAFRDGDAQGILLVFAILALPSVFAGAWVLLVEPSTLGDVVERPDDTIEVQWLQQAQSGAFTDVLLVLGLTLVAGVFVDLDVSVRLALTLVVGFAMADVAVRVLWLKRRDG